MISYPDIDPEIIRIGPLAVRWYGVMYLIGFASSYLLVKYQIKKTNRMPEDRKQETEVKVSLPISYVDSLYSYLILGLLIGARLGYVVFYNLPYYLQHPFDVFAVWHGGMSFHGGAIGSIIAGIMFCRKYKIDFWHTADLIIVTAPIGLGLGRLGNFINGELFGRVTDVPWAMVFPSGGHLSRHPSQLYEFFLEGILLFSLLWFLKDRGFRHGVLSSLFIIMYGAFRFFVEFFREPDAQTGFLFGVFTMGQALSFVMVVAGFLIFYKRKGIKSVTGGKCAG
ncbi:MAG: prolipoprotein diacylglyceryl transferase [Thermodesulfovibrionales bacterium]|nr:prolipoprotein diacylglyceryl transferase [Thermodesulfovibrionales bacterium]